jgi:ESS family glutamate:Na+ symporter
MSNFWDFSVWAWISLMAVVFGGLLLGNVLRKTVPFFRYSLIPTSVLGGIILLIFAGLYRLITGDFFFETAIFNYSGSEKLEIITYHALALGFIASAFKTNGGKLNKKRTAEIFNTGVTTVSTYLIQAIFGLGITMVIALILTDFFPAAGVLLP